MSSTLDIDKTFKFFRKYWPLSVENHIQITYKHSSKYLNIVHHILTATCRFNRHLQAEFLPRAYIELRRHLEFEIIKAESAFRFVSRVHMPTCGKSRNREITAIYSCARAQNAMSSTLDVVH